MARFVLGADAKLCVADNWLAVATAAGLVLIAVALNAMAVRAHRIVRKMSALIVVFAGHASPSSRTVAITRRSAIAIRFALNAASEPRAVVLRGRRAAGKATASSRPRSGISSSIAAGCLACDRTSTTSPSPRDGIGEALAATSGGIRTLAVNVATA